MNNIFFKQSALIISVIVTVLFVLSGWDPLHQWLGIDGPAFFYAKWLAGVWLLLAIFRNLKLKKMDAECPRYHSSCLHGMAVFGRIFTPRKWYIFSKLEQLFHPGRFHSFDRNQACFLAVFVVLTAGHLCLRFLTGYQVGKADLFMPFARLYTIMYDLIFVGSIWALISLSGRENFHKTKSNEQ